MDTAPLGFLAKLRKRRRIVVDPRLQLGLTLRVALATTLVLASMGFGLFLPLVEQLQARAAQSIEDGSAGASASALLYLHGRFWVLAAACLLTAATATLFMSHRIAGPLVRVKRHLTMVGAGELPSRLRTRRGDFLKPEVECLNDMVGELGARFGDLHSAHDKVATSLANCRDEAADTGASTSLRAELDRATEQLEQLRSLLLSPVDTSPDAAPTSHSVPNHESDEFETGTPAESPRTTLVSQ